MTRETAESLAEIRDAADDIAAAREIVSNMCRGDRWRMTIPPQREDSDVLLSRVLDGYERALGALARLASWSSADPLADAAMRQFAQREQAAPLRPPLGPARCLCDGRPLAPYAVDAGIWGNPALVCRRCSRLLLSTQQPAASTPTEDART